mmetsp:Transcript_13835/g.36283  ORF Transcript_13835/g.36283 Transcript_13835/m.36283 type:complete len:375 (+) Transcript_13835:317-1441(+)
MSSRYVRVIAGLCGSELESAAGAPLAEDLAERELHARLGHVHAQDAHGRQVKSIVRVAAPRRADCLAVPRLPPVDVAHKVAAARAAVVGLSAAAAEVDVVVVGFEVAALVVLDGPEAAPGAHQRRVRAISLGEARAQQPRGLLALPRAVLLRRLERLLLALLRLAQPGQPAGGLVHRRRAEAVRRPVGSDHLEARRPGGPRNDHGCVHQVDRLAAARRLAATVFERRPQLRSLPDELAATRRDRTRVKSAALAEDALEWREQRTGALGALLLGVPREQHLREATVGADERVDRLGQARAARSGQHGCQDVVKGEGRRRAAVLVERAAHLVALVAKALGRQVTRWALGRQLTKLGEACAADTVLLRPIATQVRLG